MKYLEIILFYLYSISDRLIQKKIYHLKLNFYEKNIVEECTVKAFSSSKLLNFVNCNVIQLYNSLILRKQDKFYMILKVIVKYRSWSVFFFMKDFIKCLNRVFFFLLVNCKYKKSKSKNFQTFLITKYDNFELYSICQECIFLSESRLNFKENILLLLSYYSFKQNIEEIFLKSSKIIFQKLMNKYGINISKKFDYLNHPCIIYMEKISNLKFEYLYYKKSSPRNFVKLMIYNKYLSENINTLLIGFSNTYNLYQNKNFWNISLISFSKKINSLVNFLFLFSSFSSILIKVLFKNILNLIGDYKILQIYRFLIDFYVSVRKNIPFELFYLNILFLERYYMNIGNYIDLKKYSIIRLKTFSIERQIKSNNQLNDFNLLHNILPDTINNKICLRLKKRLFKSRHFPMEKRFFSSHIVENLNKLTKKKFFRESGNILNKINYFIPDILVFFFSGFHILRKKVLKILSTCQTIPSICLWFVQECFLLETNKSTYHKFLDTITNYCGLINLICSKRVFRNFGPILVKTTSFIFMGLYRTRFSKLYKISNYSVKFFFKKHQKHNESSKYHFLLSILNLFTLNIFFKPVKKEFSRFPVGYNIFWKKLNAKNICTYIMSLEKKIKEMDQLFLRKRRLKYSYMIKRRKRFSNIFQDSGDLINIPNIKDCNFLFSWNNLVFENLTIAKQFLFNTDKPFLINLPKLKNIYNSNSIWNKITEKTIYYLKNKKKNLFNGYCCFCLLIMILDKNHSKNFKLKNIKIKKYFFSHLIVFSISNLLSSRINCLDFLNFYQHSFLNFLEIFKNFQLKVISKTLLINLYTVIKQNQFNTSNSNFLNFFIFLVLMTYNLYGNSFFKIFKMGEDFDFLGLFLNSFCQIKDPLIEFFFHIEKKNLYFFKKNLLFTSRSDFLGYKMLFFQKLYQLTVYFTFNYNRFFYEKIINFEQNKQLVLLKKNQKTYVKSNILNQPFFSMFKSTNYKYEFVDRFIKRIYTRCIFYNDKLKKITNTPFPDLFIFGCKCSKKSLNLRFLMGKKRQEYFLKIKPKFSFKAFLLIKNRYNTKNMIFFSKTLSNKKNRYKNIKYMQEKFLRSYFWIFSYFLCKRKNSMDMRTFLFPFKDLIVKNIFGDLIMYFYIYFLNSILYTDIIFRNSYSRIYFDITKKNCNIILKITRDRFCKYLFFGKIDGFLKKKGLYKIKKDIFFFLEYFNMFYIPNIIYNNSDQWEYNKLLKKLGKLIISGNILSKNIFNILIFTTVYFISEECIQNNTGKNKMLEIIYSSLTFLSLDLYRNWLCILMDLYSKSLCNKQKLAYLIYLAYTQVLYIKIKYKVKTKISRYVCKTRNNIVYNNIQKKTVSWFFINCEKNIFKFSTECLFFLGILSFIQSISLSKYRFFFRKLLSFFLEKKKTNDMYCSIKKITFCLCTKMIKQNFSWLLKEIEQNSLICELFLPNIYIFFDSFLLSDQIYFAKKYIVVNIFLEILFKNQNKHLYIKNQISNKNDEKIGNLVHYIFDSYGYINFCGAYIGNKKKMFEFLRKIFKKNFFLFGKILVSSIKGAFKWKESLENLLQFSSKLLISLFKKVRANKISGLKTCGDFKIQFFFIQKIVQIYIENNLEYSFSKSISEFFRLRKKLFNIVEKYVDDTFDKTIVFVLTKRKKIRHIILRNMFSLYYRKIFLKKKMIVNKYDDKIKILIFILCRIILKLKTKFIKIHIYKLNTLTVIFVKFLFSGEIDFQILGLKGLYILFKKKILSKKQINLLQYISFLYIKSLQLSMQIACGSIIIGFLSIKKNLSNRFISICHIFLSFLNNKKITIRLKSLEIILRMFSNMKFLNGQTILRKILYTALFHFIFDTELICQFLAGLIAKIIILKLDLFDMIILNGKTCPMSKFSSQWIDIQTKITMFWIHNVCIDIKNYILIKIYTNMGISSSCQKQIKSRNSWDNVYLKLYYFNKSLDKRRWCVYIPFIYKIFLIIIFKFAQSSILMIKFLFCKIIKLFLEFIFEGNMGCFVFLQNPHIISSLVLFKYTLVTIEIILKIEINLITNFLPHLFRINNTNIINCYDKKINITTKEDYSRKFLRKIDIFIQHETYTYFYFSKKIYVSVFFLDIKNMPLKMGRIINMKLNFDEFKFIKNIIKILVKMVIQ
nr:hypothetical protein 1634Bnrm1_p156 [Cryptomonas sp.]